MACMSIVIKTTKYKEEFRIIIIIPNKNCFIYIN